MNTPIEIFCDFDGTISIDDTTDILLEKLAAPGWRQLEAAWEAGEIGSRECMAQQIKLISGGWQAVAKVLDSVELEPSFKPFVQWCRKAGIPLRIVSDGLDKVINYLLMREGIKVDFIFANRLVESPQGHFSLLFPYSASEAKAMCSSGVCKCKLLESSRASSTKVVIGDGRSDFCWAPAADVLFAKSKLLKHCLEEQIPHVTFKDFNNIAYYIEEHIISVPAPAPTLVPAFELRSAS
jgi:2,3-diketo-5-methylthio-1-phosphopentane phosphatase